MSTEDDYLFRERPVFKVHDPESLPPPEPALFDVEEDEGLDLRLTELEERVQKIEFMLAI